MGDPTQVYCDSKELLQQIVSVYPSKEGLFPHELGMLLYISWGTTTTKEQNWRGVWEYTYFVNQPQELLLSLINRGYIKESSNDELFDCVKMRDIQRILKDYGVKPGNNKEKALELLRHTVSGEQLYEKLGYRYYILSEAGRAAVLNNLGPDSHSYPEWDIEMNSHSSKITADQIIKRGKMVDENNEYDLFIDSSTLSSKLYFSNTKSEVHQNRVIAFDIPSKLRIMVDNELLFSSMGINTYQVLKTSKIIVVGKAEGNKTVDCVAYDIIKRSLIAKEIVDYGVYLNGPTYEMMLGINRLNESDRNLHTNGTCIRFSFSVHDVLADEIINKYVAKKTKVLKIPPFVPEDITLNYTVELDQNDTDLQKLVYYMTFCRMLDKPEIMGVPINEALRALAFHSDKKIEQAIIEEHTQRNPNVVIAAQLVSYYISPNYIDVISVLSEYYSDKAMSSDPFGHWYGNDLPRYFLDISKNKENYDKQFKELVLSLKRDGVIDIKWISEFSLYKLVLSYYPDAEYQKHFNWLGQQSLDIYIPQLNTGIEYQGQQHYSAIEIFGGEEGYMETTARDERKRKLCSENGVRLIEWPFELEISSKNLNMLLKH